MLLVWRAGLLRCRLRAANRALRFCLIHDPPACLPLARPQIVRILCRNRLIQPVRLPRSGRHRAGLRNCSL